MRFRLVSGDAFRLELLSEAAEGPRSEAVFTFQATFLDTGEGPVRAGEVHVAHGFWNEALLLRTAGRERLYLNEVLLVDAERGDGEVEPRALRFGIAVENGTVEVRTLSILLP